MTDFARRWDLAEERFWLHGVHRDRTVEHDEELGRWNVYGYDEVLEILNDPVTYTPDATRLFDLDEEAAKYVEGDMSQLTGPEHAHMRKHVGQAFTPRAMHDLESRVLATADTMLEQLREVERFDLLNDFVEDLCAIVFSQLLGTPVEEREVLRVKDQAMDFDGQMATVPGDDDEEYFSGLVAPLRPLREFLGVRIDAAWDDPRDDLLGLMIKYRKLDGSRMTRDEIINFGISVLGAGRLSTPMLIGNTLLCLESFPDQAERVRADRSLVPSLIEESMRFMSPGNMSFRATNAERELGGVTIPADQLVMLWFGAANRDGRQFTDPDRFDAGRNPNHHLGFGRGTYYCVGAQMVRIETRIMFNLLLDKFPQLRLDPEKSPVFFGSPEFTGVRSLPVIAH